MKFIPAIKYRLQKYTVDPLLPFIRFKRKIQNKCDLVILCYHRVREKTGIFYDRNISASPEEFREQMLYIRTHFTPVSIDEVIDSYRGSWELKPNSILITFDDGYKDNALNALPILDEFGIPAVVFVVTGFIDTDHISLWDRISYAFNTIKLNEIKITNDDVYLLKSQGERENSIWKFCKMLRGINNDHREKLVKDIFEKYKIDKNELWNSAQRNSLGYMTKNDIQYWSNRGIDFGMHTVNHPSFNTLSKKEMFLEVSESKKTIENILGKTVSVFAYPFGKEGDFNETSKSVLESAGIDVGMIFNPGINNPAVDKYELYRIGIDPNINFKLACHGFS